MNDDLAARLRATPIVPLIQVDDPAVAVRTALALTRSGLTVIEVVLRSERALESLREVAAACPHALVGAGTVLSIEQAAQSIAQGARFIVSPGLDEQIVQEAQRLGSPVLPGIATPSEAQAARRLGLGTVKFFPAHLAGGAPMIQALASVFRGMYFMPSGGISMHNLAEFLSMPQVIACSGSWLTPASAIHARDYEQIATLAAQALSIAQHARGI